MDDTTGNAKKVWSPAELARALGVTVQHVRRLIRNGTIAHFRIGAVGRRIFIPQAEVEALLAGRHQASRHAPSDDAT